MSPQIQCPKCYGTKGFPGLEAGDGKCDQCQGTGAAGLFEGALESFNILNDERAKCFKCKGTGICQTCSGAGILTIVQDNDPSAHPAGHRGSVSDYVGPGSAGGYSCVAWLIGLVAAAIAVLFAVLTVIVTIPIWIGAIAVSVITAYLYSAKRIREIGAPELGQARLVQVQGKRRPKVKVAPEFLQSQIRWNPDRLIAGGSGILYALLIGGILVLYNTDRIGKTMFGIAIVVGGTLAWKSGRKILELRISEAVLTARQIPSNGPRNAAQIGFGLSCAAAFALLVLIVASVVNGPGPTRPPGTQVATQPGFPSPTRTVPRTLPQANEPLRNVPTSRPPQTDAWRQPPKFAETTPTAAPSATPGEQYRVFIDQSRNSTASSPAVSSDQVTQFINRVMELEKTQQIEAILGNYAARVKYFDNGTVDHAFIRKDKSDYYSRWPARSYEITGNIYSTSLGQNLWEIRVPTKFRVVNQRGEWIEGDVLQILTVNTASSHWLITAEDGEVTRREKGTGQTPASDTQSSATTGSSQAIGGGAFRGKGAVYRIPDLRTLVGKELSNAWLYGEFAFERQNGNIAICRTAVTVLFVGKGTTRVNIEFEQGFSVSSRILRSMRDPQLPLTYMLRAGPNDPLRLLRVRQNRDGTLEAFAQSPIRLDMQ
jgi:hypothetical protein